MTEPASINKSVIVLLLFICLPAYAGEEKSLITLSDKTRWFCDSGFKDEHGKTIYDCFNLQHGYRYVGYVPLTDNSEPYWFKP